MIQDLALILIVAGVVTLLFKKLRQPLVLGYIVAGFLVSPKMPYFMNVIHGENVEHWANIGVMFLMFCLGLEFSFKKIVDMGIAPIKSALFIVSTMMLLGFTIGNLFGWTLMNCIFLGGMLAMSSTTIIYKAFDDLELRQQSFTSVVMSVLILEDIFAILLMVILQTIAGGNIDGGSIVDSFLLIICFVSVSFLLGIFLLPYFLRSVRKLMTAETLLIVSLGLCCFMAVVAEKFHFSTAFGAFIMGSILAETSEVELINKTVEPVKNLFGAIFFVSVGMLVDATVIVSYWLPILILVVTILFGQTFFGSLGYFIGGQTLKSALQCGFSMSQIGEFSFIIATLGLSLGVLSDFVYPVVVAVSVITTFLTPYMIRAALPAYIMLEKFLPKKFLQKSNARSLKNHMPEYLQGSHFAFSIAKRIYLQSRINAGSMPIDSHRIMDRNLHFSEFSVPEGSLWIGQTLQELQFGSKYFVHVSSILRGRRRINIPLASERLYPNDRLQVIGNDENLTIFAKALSGKVYSEDENTSDANMKLVQIVVDEKSMFFKKDLRQLNLRQRFCAMLVGIEKESKQLAVVSPDYEFKSGDILWLVCEKKYEKDIR